jgi:hypothetical protein
MNVRARIDATQAKVGFPSNQKTAQIKLAVPNHLTAPARASLMENADAYHQVIARLNKSWRVIVCREDLQWILQRWRAPLWRNRSFCMTTAALRREAQKHGGDIDPAAWETLLALPAHFAAMRPITRTRPGVLE